VVYGAKYIYFDILNRFGMNHECDEQTDGQMDRHSKSKYRDSLRCAAKSVNVSKSFDNDKMIEIVVRRKNSFLPRCRHAAGV